MGVEGLGSVVRGEGVGGGDPIAEVEVRLRGRRGAHGAPSVTQDSYGCGSWVSLGFNINVRYRA